MIIIKHKQVKKDVPNVVIHNIEKDLDVQLASMNVKLAIGMVILVPYDTGRGNLNIKCLWSQGHQKHINFRLVQFAHKIPYVASQKRAPVMIHSACK